MAPPNATWQQIIAQAHANPEILKQTEVIRSIQNVLQTNVSVCSSLGQPFSTQFNLIFQDMLAVRQQLARVYVACLFGGALSTCGVLLRGIETLGMRCAGYGSHHSTELHALPCLHQHLLTSAPAGHCLLGVCREWVDMSLAMAVPASRVTQVQ